MGRKGARVRIRTPCPGCGELTSRAGHLIQFDPETQTVLLYCPEFDEWYRQHSLFGVERVIPPGQQLGLI